ncbi:MAG: TetR/AcrR family transcriptional regulator [Pseudomonadota bacterium]
MGRQKTGDKFGDIRRAAVSEVVECGSASASVNAIARRANLSVGTIYRYYDNKDHLLRSVYLAIKTDIHRSMMEAAERATGSKAKIRAIWFALLEYAHAKPHDFLFAEVIMNAALLTETEQAEVDAMSQEALAHVEAAVEDGSIRPGDLRAISTLLIAPALQLGRAAARGGERPDAARAEETFNLCWRAIAT